MWPVPFPAVGSLVLATRYGVSLTLGCRRSDGCTVGARWHGVAGSAVPVLTVGPNPLSTAMTTRACQRRGFG